MGYIIYDDDNYISQDATGRYSVVTDIDRATTWKKAVKANNVCKEVKRTFKGYNFKVKFYTKEEEREQKAAQPACLDYDALGIVEEFCALMQQMTDRKPYIEERIYELELEIADIEHAAEFYNLNAAQGYRLYKLLHDVRNERRNLKNQLEQIEMFEETTLNLGEMEKLKRQILGTKSREYTPRINNELFGV